MLSSTPQLVPNSANELLYLQQQSATVGFGAKHIGYYVWDGQVSTASTNITNFIPFHPGAYILDVIVVSSGFGVASFAMVGGQWPLYQSTVGGPIDGSISTARIAWTLANSGNPGVGFSKNATNNSLDMNFNLGTGALPQNVHVEVRVIGANQINA